MFITGAVFYFFHRFPLVVGFIYCQYLSVCAFVRGMAVPIANFFGVIYLCLGIVLIFASEQVIPHVMMIDELTGAWRYKGSNEEELLLFVDGYHTHTVYSNEAKSFTETSGGVYSI